MIKKFLSRNHLFTWEGINKKGLRTRGQVFGKSKTSIQAELELRGIKPIKINKKIINFAINSKRIRLKDIVFFSRHLATLVDAGIPLVVGLEIISKSQHKTSMQNLLQAVKNDVQSGKAFHLSLANYSTHFPRLFINLIKAGEESGTLDIMLNRLAEYLEKTDKLKKSVRKALYYPTVVLTSTIIASSMLLIFIVPQFEALFDSFGAKLPLFTRIIIQTSSLFQKYWLMFLGVASFIIFSFYHYLTHSKKFKFRLDALLLKMPVFGEIIKKSNISKISKTLATTLSAGIPLLESLSTAALQANNVVFSTAILQIREEIAIGQEIHTAMELTQVFPNMVIQMVAIGEESGTVDKMLEKIATFFEEDVQSLVSGLSTLIEPMIIIILGLLIGSFVLAMYLPIFKLGSIV